MTKSSDRNRPLGPGRVTNRSMVTDRVITSAAQVTPEWLTAVLRREGVLDRGEVVTVNASSLPHLMVSPRTEKRRDCLRELLCR